jgi:two-component system sensor histidine kinase YesM
MYYSENKTPGRKTNRQYKKILASRIYCGLFVVGSVVGFMGLILYRVPSWAFVGYILAFMLFLYLLLLLQNEGQHKKRRNELIDELNQTKTHMQQIQLQKRQEQLNALQSQINPHFLYNTLDTIRGLAIEKESMDIANIVAALASMFKYSVDYASTNVTLNDELSHLGKYIKIQSMRFPGKFHVEQIYDCEQDALFQVNIPKLTLQPIVENAISHGLKNKTSGGIITIRFIASDMHFKVIVSDNGSGIPEDTVLALNNSFRKNNPEYEMQDPSRFGIALSNIDLRIKIYCGEGYGLFVASTPGIGTDVTVTLPAPKVEP